MGMSVLTLGIVAIVGFIAYKKFVKKDLWGDKYD
jgi:hypothetical protein